MRRKISNCQIAGPSIAFAHILDERGAHIHKFLHRPAPFSETNESSNDESSGQIDKIEEKKEPVLT